LNATVAPRLFAITFLLLPAIAQADPPAASEHLHRFARFWRTNVPAGCGEIRAGLVSRPNPDSGTEARDTYLRIKLSGGAVSWPGTQNVWNIAVIEDVALNALVTSDALDFILCHELGHRSQETNPVVASDLNAEELLADRHAIEACLPAYWGAASARAFRARAEAAVRSAMDYYSEFLSTLALGAGDADRRTFECRKAAGLARIAEKPVPACVRSEFGRDFHRKLGSPIAAVPVAAPE
jgi:hypothetical protein